MILQGILCFCITAPPTEGGKAGRYAVTVFDAYLVEKVINRMVDLARFFVACECCCGILTSLHR